MNRVIEEREIIDEFDKSCKALESYFRYKEYSKAYELVDQLQQRIKNHKEKFIKTKKRINEKEQFIRDHKVNFDNINKNEMHCIDRDFIFKKLQLEGFYSINTLKIDAMSSMMKLYREMYNKEDEIKVLISK